MHKNIFVQRNIGIVILTSCLKIGGELSDIMPVCLTRSFTFNASARRVELIPPSFRQRPLGSSNGGPKTVFHKGY